MLAMSILTCLLFLGAFECTSILEGNQGEEFLIPEKERFIFEDNTQLQYRSSLDSVQEFKVSIYNYFREECNTDYIISGEAIWTEICWEVEHQSISIGDYFALVLIATTDDMSYTSEQNFFYQASTKNGEYNRGITGYDLGPESSLSSLKIYINDQSYNVFRIEDTQDEDSLISVIYVNSNYGVLRFKMDDGELWELQNL